MSVHQEILQKYKSGDVLAHFRANRYTYPISPASWAVLFSCRWTDPTVYCVFERIAVGVNVYTVVTPQDVYPISLKCVRNYTANENTGNDDSLLPTDFTGKSFVNMESTRMEQMSLASISAGISGGVGIEDASYTGQVPVTDDLSKLGINQQMSDLLDYGRSESYPLILSANEGIRVKWGFGALGTGIIRVIGQFSWAEVELP